MESAQDLSRDFSQRGGRDRDSLLPGVEVPGQGGDDRPSCCPQIDAHAA